MGETLFKGIVPAVLTPLDADGVAEERLRRHIDFLVERGVHGLYPTGTTGEGVLLSENDRRRVAEIVIDQAAGRIPVMIHVGHLSTRVTVELARHAVSVGADAVGVVAPYFYTFTQAQ